MKGFVVTIVSVSLIMILLTMSISLKSSQLSTERKIIEPLPMIYGAALFDDAAYELNTIAGPQIEINQTNQSTVVLIEDTLDTDNRSQEIEAYAQFLESKVAERVASNISTNFTNITNGTIRMWINGDYLYSNDHKEQEILFSKDDGTGVLSYEISITVFSLRQNVSSMPFSENGTINVTITYTDLNGTVVEEGKIYPDVRSSMQIEYPEGSGVDIDLGAVGGSDGSLKIEGDNVYAVISVSATLPALNSQMKKGFEYDATMHYRQGAVSIERRLGN